MKEFSVIIKCETAAQLATALEDAAEEVRFNEELVDDLETDAEFDLVEKPTAVLTRVE